jgi:hypothetical protein
MKKTILWLVVCLGWCATVCAEEKPAPKVHPDSSKWENLFTADLSNAFFPKGVWFFENGALTASEDQCIWTKKEYENFVVDLEFKNGEAANSGVLVYCTDHENWIPNAIEVQILDDYAAKWADVAKNWRCASIFAHEPPTKQTVKKAGEWNRMTVTCKGSTISVALNGELVTNVDLKKWTSAQKNPDGTEIPSWLGPTPLAERPTKGHVGLQGKHGGAPIYFRNVKIKTLE